METLLYTTSGPRRNSQNSPSPLPHHLDVVDHLDLSRGGREVYRRTRWSPPVCNMVADLAGIGREV